MLISSVLVFGCPGYSNRPSHLTELLLFIFDLFLSSRVAHTVIAVVICHSFFLTFEQFHIQIALTLQRILHFLTELLVLYNSWNRQ